MRTISSGCAFLTDMLVSCALALALATGVFVAVYTSPAFGQANMMDWRRGKPGIMIATNAPSRADLAAHTNRTDNPHLVTPQQIGALPLGATNGLQTAVGVTNLISLLAQPKGPVVALRNTASNEFVTLEAAGLTLWRVTSSTVSDYDRITVSMSGNLRCEDEQELLYLYPWPAVMTLDYPDEAENGTLNGWTYNFRTGGGLNSKLDYGGGIGEWDSGADLTFPLTLVPTTPGANGTLSVDWATVITFATNYVTRYASTNDLAATVYALTNQNRIFIDSPSATEWATVEGGLVKEWLVAPAFNMDKIVITLSPDFAESAGGIKPQRLVYTNDYGVRFVEGLWSFEIPNTIGSISVIDYAHPEEPSSWQTTDMTFPNTLLAQSPAQGSAAVGYLIITTTNLVSSVPLPIAAVPPYVTSLTGLRLWLVWQAGAVESAIAPYLTDFATTAELAGYVSLDDLDIWTAANLTPHVTDPAIHVGAGEKAAWDGKPSHVDVTNLVLDAQQMHATMYGYASKPSDVAGAYTLTNALPMGPLATITNTATANGAYIARVITAPGLRFSRIPVGTLETSFRYSKGAAGALTARPEFYICDTAGNRLWEYDAASSTAAFATVPTQSPKISIPIPTNLVIGVGQRLEIAIKALVTSGTPTTYIDFEANANFIVQVPVSSSEFVTKPEIANLVFSEDIVGIKVFATQAAYDEWTPKLENWFYLVKVPVE